MPRLFPRQKTRAPDRLEIRLPPPRLTVPWHVIVLRYSPTSRRTFRRVLLAAQAHGITVKVQHDHGMLFRLHLLTLTGTPAALASFRKRLDQLHPLLAPWWAR
ncbi:hypothetical protein ACIBKY_03610 [Nonomuraea sp. NPDC050394]|uniref:hypothetical protein n=1 Tax=Nonomuraea sp. NPDC050394 TaxID=3364363 RepID=UPI0037B94F8D